MKRSKGMQLGAMLAAMLLVSIAFMPTVGAKADSGKQNLSDPAVVKALLDKFAKEGPNAEKFFAKLSPEEQAALREALKVSRIETIVSMNESEVSIAGITCNSPRVQLISYAPLGNKLWSYTQTINRCYDGSKITEASRTRSAEVYMPTWTFAGHIDSTESGGANYSYYRAYTQGLFKNCILGICGTEKTPYIDMVVYGDGGYWHNEGGN